jgi:hypothetical protein
MRDLAPERTGGGRRARVGRERFDESQVCTSGHTRAIADETAGSMGSIARCEPRKVPGTLVAYAARLAYRNMKEDLHLCHFPKSLTCRYFLVDPFGLWRSPSPR